MSEYPQARTSWYENLRRSWHVIAFVAACSLWVGQTVQSPEQIDSSISTAVGPLHERQDWLESEILRTEQQQRNGQSVSQSLTRLEARVRLLESRRTDAGK